MVSPLCLVCGGTSNCQMSALGTFRDKAWLRVRTLTNQTKKTTLKQTTLGYLPATAERELVKTTREMSGLFSAIALNTFSVPSTAVFTSSSSFTFSLSFFSFSFSFLSPRAGDLSLSLCLRSGWAVATRSANLQSLMML